MLKEESITSSLAQTRESRENTTVDNDRCIRLEYELEQARQEINAVHAILEESIARANQMTIEAELASIELLQLFNASMDCTWVVDKDFNIYRINETFRQLLHNVDSNFVGKKCYEVFDYGLCHTPACPLTQVVKNNRQKLECDVEATINGHLLSFILNVSPFKGIENEIIGMVSCFKDITDRKRTEQLLHEANKELERIATIDGLTQLANRRRFNEYLEIEWKRSMRAHTPLSLIMCDVDYFKFFNDCYGHLAGDECLQKVAGTLKNCARRASDLVARYGGEEFAIVLPNTPAGGAMHVAELIRQKVLELQIEHTKSLVAPYVTLSLGVASAVPERTSFFEALIDSADQALYRAKKGGRNRTILL